MNDHKCSVDKLDVQWQSYLVVSNDYIVGEPLPKPKWRANFICTVCGKERTWEKLVEVIPFKELKE